MKLDIDYPERIFRLWIYVPTHSKLLLRSGLETSGTSRIDIAFGGVLAVSLPVSMEGLTIGKPDSKSIRSVAAQLGSRLNLDDLLIVRGRDYGGYIVASIIEIDESDRRMREQDKWGITPPG
ncbi:hypothetical protein [Streptosporangium sp. LJ11]|uniref:hypothetical protein n=1 Tax=Streptosporangium sp. LJ11 TaxID=3436927 RepID=UPI003F7A8D49